MIDIDVLHAAPLVPAPHTTADSHRAVANHVALERGDRNIDDIAKTETGWQTGLNSSRISLNTSLE